MIEGLGRRRFLGSAVLGAATALLPPAASAETMPPLRLGDAPPGSAAEVSWKLTSSFPKTLDLLYGGAEDFARRVALLTGGKFHIEVSPPGEPVSGLQGLDAVQNGTVDACQTFLDYFYGKDPAFAVPTAIPFGMNAREQTAFALEGNGNDLLNDFLKDFGVVALPAGNTGAQMGGFFRKELKSLADLNGLKIRTGGLAGRVLQKLGAVPEQTPRSELHAALDKGDIDAVTWVGPYDDQKIEGVEDPGLQKVAPFYYYPGWWRGGSMVHLVFGKAKYEALSEPFRTALQTAALATHTSMLASYDARNPGALKQLVVGGAKLRAFPQDVLEAAYRATSDLLKEISDGNPRFKTLLDATLAFRSDQYLWWQVSEYTFDNFMIRQRARG